ncbi:hypothetical protein BDK51DRAFT_37617 [Blyttiomyces helicus]|uniref:Uncharacterized protein n=1 Tax=Blyttiomyces helicus TaxID=388810 RepID=A0A4P9WKQ1_9FUNG|nr:hypothetical protein BDK51DRAFT_37617 [Blyttiomyces helicus]|eukprot:RKO92603.1 hypothetical protein BDK51DRAFT_37617 [Blyttiomyces helicus]
MPLDWAMLLGESWALVEWDYLFDKLSYGLALVLNALCLGIKYERVAGGAGEPPTLYSIETLEDDSDEGWLAWFYDGEFSVRRVWAAGSGLRGKDRGSVRLTYSSSSFAVQYEVLEYMLWAISLVNAIHLFNRSKRYILLKQPTKPAYASDESHKIKSRNARLVSVNTGRPGADVDEDEDDEFPSIIQRTWRYFSPPTEPTDGAKELKWELSVWEPPQGSLNLFISNWPYCFTLAFCTAATVSRTPSRIFPRRVHPNTHLELPHSHPPQMHVVVTAFQDLVKDREILSSQLLREFTEGFVYTLPPFRATSSAAVGSDEPWDADSDTAGGDGDNEEEEEEVVKDNVARSPHASPRAGFEPATAARG